MTRLRDRGPLAYIRDRWLYPWVGGSRRWWGL